MLCPAPWWRRWTGIESKAFSNLFVVLAKRAGLPPIRLHDLRHSSATAALASGVPVKVVSQRIGHADVGVGHVGSRCKGGEAMSDVEKPSWWRSASPPLNWPTSGGKWHGRVTLPEHLSWSGPSSTFDLDVPAELRVVYATVLREGSENDVRMWIHQPTLLAIWDSLWLPSAVHEAWDGWIREHRVHVAV